MLLYVQNSIVNQFYVVGENMAKIGVDVVALRVNLNSVREGMFELFVGMCWSSWDNALPFHKQTSEVCKLASLNSRSVKIVKIFFSGYWWPIHHLIIMQHVKNISQRRENGWSNEVILRIGNRHRTRYFGSMEYVSIHSGDNVSTLTKLNSGMRKDHTMVMKLFSNH